MLPVSISCLRKNVVAPVSFSPLMIAQLIGAAPRYWGSNEAWRLNVPSEGIAHTTSGNILNATTIWRLAWYDLSSSRNSGDFRLVGCNTGMLCFNAHSFTGDAESF